ncbi:hypothetical protein CI1B_85070 [Bradyrhizobium ivorense]|uniref:Permuted papain-like amidase YaeF/Yiix C92 family enzyme n=1 Tax=Bradyrhizobium ivorense TaxID=2511166 RepID=A0A508U1V4_9BRAD|nr:hypothetical protein [Bradyrhizobium ivorense]VIO80689.1 hypothetical protein CI1B_85070 [Bradyrhizobium ivorense]
MRSSDKARAAAADDHSGEKVFWRFDPDHVQPGDILVTRTPSLKSLAIRAATRTEFSHAALCIGYGHFIEAIGTGVCRFAIKGTSVRKRDNVRLLRLRRDVPHAQAIAKFAADAGHQDLQRGYSLAGAVGVKLPTKPDPRAMFCSQLVVEAYDKAMRMARITDPLVPGRKLSKIAPGHLPESPYLEDATDSALKQMRALEGPYWYLDEPNPEQRPHQWETEQKLKMLGSKSVQSAIKKTKADANPRSFFELELLLRDTKSKDLDAVIAAALQRTNFCELYSGKIASSLDLAAMKISSDQLISRAAGGQMPDADLAAEIVETGQQIRLFEDDLSDRKEQYSNYVKRAMAADLKTFAMLGELQGEMRDLSDDILAVLRTQLAALQEAERRRRP